MGKSGGHLTQNPHSFPEVMYTRIAQRSSISSFRVFWRVSSAAERLCSNEHGARFSCVDVEAWAEGFERSS